jgi:hypothetical protein
LQPVATARLHKRSILAALIPRTSGAQRRIGGEVEIPAFVEGSSSDKSKQQFIDEVLAPFGARFSASGDPFRPVTIRSVHADGDTVIVLWDGRGTANDGKPYENSYAWFMKMRDGKVIDGTAFYDSISFNELWSRVQPR